MQVGTPTAATRTTPTGVVKNATTAPESGSFAAVLERRHEQQNDARAKRSGSNATAAEGTRKDTRTERKESARGSARESVPEAGLPKPSWSLNTASMGSRAANGNGDPDQSVEAKQVEGASAPLAKTSFSSSQSGDIPNLGRQIAGLPLVKDNQQGAWSNGDLNNGDLDNGDLDNGGPESAGLRAAGNAFGHGQEILSGEPGVSGTTSSDPSFPREGDGPAINAGWAGAGEPSASSLANIPGRLDSDLSTFTEQGSAGRVSTVGGKGQKTGGTLDVAQASSSFASPSAGNVPGWNHSFRDGALQGATLPASREQGAEQGGPAPDAKTAAASVSLGKPRKDVRAAMAESSSLSNTTLPDGSTLASFGLNVDGGAHASTSVIGLGVGGFGAEQDRTDGTALTSTHKPGRSSEADLLDGRSSVGVSNFGAPLGAGGTGMGSSGLNSGLGSGAGSSTGDGSKNSAKSAAGTGVSPDGCFPGGSHTAGLGAGATLPSVNTARLMNSLTQSEMRVGVRSAEFGAVTVHTTIGRAAVSAQISLENAQLGTALSAHLPSIEQKLAQDHGLRASVTLHTGSGAGNDAGAGSGTGAQGERRQAGQGRRGATTEDTGSPFWSTANGSSVVLTPPASLSRSGQGRLDVRI